MTLIDRIARLFRADIHDLLDRIEEPAVVLRQAVRDMEKELSLDEQSIRQLVRDDERLVSRLKEIESSLNDIEAQLDVCFQSGREELARRLIKRRLEMQNLHKQMCGKRSQLADRLAMRKARFQENQARLEEIRQKAEWLADEAPDEDFSESKGYSSDVIRDEDVEVAFLSEKQIRSRS
ncbi:MAG: PspA/IM30 family protein [Methylococcales bacterium]